MVDAFGIGFAVLGAGMLAGMSLSVRMGTSGGRTYDVLVVTLLINIVVFVPAAAVLYYPDYRISPAAALTFAAVGVLSTLLARAISFESIKRIGASRSDSIKASQPFYASIIAVIVLGESLNGPHLFGIALVVVGVAIITWQGADNPGFGIDARPRDFSLPALAALFFGLEPVLVKVGFGEGAPLVLGLVIKILTASIGFFGYLWWAGELPRLGTMDRTNLKWYVAAGLANTGFLLAYYYALSVSRVVLVVPIIQTSPLIVIAMSYLFLQRLEQVTLRLAAAGTVVVLGAMLVTVYG